MSSNKIIALIDMDCFYCQVECKITPSLKGNPLAVVQYNTWKGGGIIAVNYEARAKGVTRHMRGDEAKQHCPEIHLCRVPSVRGKADISKYRNAGREVIAVLSEFSNIVERASIDEAYIDLTNIVRERMKTMGANIKPEQLKNTFIVGYCPDNNNDDALREKGILEWLSKLSDDNVSSDTIDQTTDYLELATAGVIVEEIRTAVWEKTQFHCSAGIAHNKVLAKLVCGLHKPKKQSILPHSCVSTLYSTLPIKKVRHLGGKLGDQVVEQLQCSTMNELEKFTLIELQNKFDEKTANWLFNIARGVDHEPVNARLISKSIGCCKRFPGKTALNTKKDVFHWIQELADEICERIEDDFMLNKRRAQLLTVSFTQEIDGIVNSYSRSTQLLSYKLQDIIHSSMQVICKTNTAPSNSESWTPPLLFLGLSAAKFKNESCHQSINQYFKPSTNINNNVSMASSAPSFIENNISQNFINETIDKNGSKTNKKLKTKNLFTNIKTNQNFEFYKLKNKIFKMNKNDLNIKLKEIFENKITDENDLFHDIENQINVMLEENITGYLKMYLNQTVDMDTDILLQIEKEIKVKIELDIKDFLENTRDILNNDDRNDINLRENIKIDEIYSNKDNIFNRNDNKNSINSNNRKLGVKVSSVNVAEQLNPTTSTSNMIESVTYTRRQIDPEEISNMNNSIPSLSFDNNDTPLKVCKTIDEICNKVYMSKSVNHNYSNKTYSFFSNYAKKLKDKELNRHKNDIENIGFNNVNVNLEVKLSPSKLKDDLLEESRQSADLFHAVSNIQESVSNYNTTNITKLNNNYKNNSFFKRYFEKKEINNANKISTSVNEFTGSQTLKNNHSLEILPRNIEISSITSDEFEDIKKVDELLNENIHNEDKTKDHLNEHLMYNDNGSIHRNDTIINPKYVDEHGHNKHNTDHIESSKLSFDLTEINGDDHDRKIICSECNKKIDLEDVGEHSDYHFALNLSRQTTNSINASSSTTKTSNKRSGTSKSSNYNIIKKSKTINDFFKPRDTR